MQKLLEAAYPEHEWDTNQFSRNQKFSRQKHLTRVIHKLFPGIEILHNVRNLQIQSSKNANLEVDIYIPSLKLALEFQESHHYFTSQRYSSDTLADYKERDREKMSQLSKLGITLIHIPFWWQFDEDSLVSTIQLHRPDLLTNFKSNAVPIPADPPVYIQDEFSQDIPGLGEVMLPIDMPTTTSFDPSGWLIFEKFDGIRAVWQPIERTFYSRKGNVLTLPSLVTDCMAPIWLDGEIWFGPGTKESVKISSGLITRVNWDKFSYIAFDSPDFENSFEKRLLRLSQYISPSHPFVRIADYQICNNGLSLFNQIKARNGEGIILRNPNSFYVNGYSNTFYKYKGIKEAQAKVLRRLSPTEYLCSIFLPKALPGGVDAMDYKLQLDPSKKDELIAPGNIDPQKAQITRVRPDLSWEDLKNSSSSSPIRTPWGGKLVFTPPKQKWSDVQERRKFFEKIASEAGFDPVRHADNWAKIPLRTVLKKGGGQILQYHNGSHIDAIIDLFPEAKIHRDLFVTKGQWDTKESHIKFFDELAKEMKFSPSDIKRWYALDSEEVRNKKGGRQIIKQYGSYVDALISVYPNLGMDKEDFLGGKIGRWKDHAARRKFFENLANEFNFDKLDKEMWYTISSEEICSLSGGKSLLKHYSEEKTGEGKGGGSSAKAIMDAFPELKWDSTSFKKNPGKWKDPENRRKYFKQIAEDFGFEISDTQQWEKLSSADIIKNKGGGNVLQYHKGSHLVALSDLFPELGFSYESTKSKWGDAKNRRAFFEEIAKSMNFEISDRDKWYTIPPSTVMQQRGGKSVLNYHNRSHEQAIIDLFPEMQFNKALFNNGYPTKWRDPKNRRKFMEELAKEKGFFYSDAKKWYSVTSQDIKKKTGGRTILEYHQGSHINVITELFPELDLKTYAFPTTTVAGQWKDKAARRNFFEQLAREEKKDAADPTYWYNMTYQRVVAKKGGNQILKYYGWSHIKAIMELFPELNLVRERFVGGLRGYWKDPANRRKFFEELAHDLGFSATDTKCWYTVSSSQVIQKLGGGAVLEYHGNSYIRALLDLFPELQLQKEKFKYYFYTYSTTLI